MNDDLPEGWIRVRLRDGAVTGVQTGFACGAYNRLAHGIAHLRPMNVSEEGTIELTNVKFVHSSEVGREERLLMLGDVLFNNTNSPELVGKTAHYGDPEPRAFSNHMTRVRCRTEALDSRFCAMSLHQRWREGYFRAVCNNHVSQASVSRAVLLDTEIGLPPLAEQRRIVEKIESLLARVNAARDRLAKLPAILKRFRQSVYAAACSGGLSEDWRKSIAKTESAPALLEMVLRTRAESRFREPRKPDDLKLDCPATWCLASYDQLSGLVTSGSRGWAQYYSNEGALFIRAQDINTDRLALDAAAHVTPAGGAEGVRTRVQRWDILITITGANVARAAVVNDPIEEGYVSQHVALVRPVLPQLAQWLHLWTVSPSHGRAQLLEAAYGAGKPGLNLDNVREMVIALPPLEEQREIVRRAEALSRLADAIERRVAAATARADRLTQAILAKAFCGELVRTEAELARQERRDYEPASALLERVRATQATDGGAGERRKPRRRDSTERPRKTKIRVAAGAGRSHRL